MADNNDVSSSGDTLEFLRIMGAAPDEGRGDSARDDDDEFSRIEGVPSIDDGSTVAMGALPPVDQPSEPLKALPPQEEEEPKPVVIKGGPRRVVRADGRQPETSYALGQRRFSLSSGHAMFKPKKKRNVLRDSLIAAGGLALAVALFAGVWGVTQSSLTREQQESLVGTGQYDASLSLTPAQDGGYYTVFFITSTPTNEKEIGELSQIAIFRTDRSVSTAMRISAPTDLYVAPNRYSETPLTVSQVLADQGIARAVQAVDDAFGFRVYNVVCCQEPVYNELYSVIDGTDPSSSVDPASLLGEVRTNLSLDDLVQWCGKLGSLDQSAIPYFAAPTTDLDVDGSVMAQGNPQSFNNALTSAMAFQVVGYDDAGNPILAQKDERGNYRGTQYDEAGNPVLDETGAPAGALRDENGNLVFDAQGYLQFYGQQYDEHGNPVGTHYDENGNALFDEWGNPLGTQYNEDGSDYIYDWRGNIVINPI